ncbi:hypothetical protein [Streptomyces sp. BE20]|uniref:hypothetical protein n=1 Tax=Streptomycetaceae TaxID=2062 RepID=UPI002E766097|nr:hypothetical protein [Streptomyces sp. BE20]MEE1823739.1 hypothetical protein [Streptomyces sp. BE20]
MVTRTAKRPLDNQGLVQAAALLTACVTAGAGSSSAADSGVRAVIAVLVVVLIATVALRRPTGSAAPKRPRR